MRTIRKQLVLLALAFCVAEAPRAARADELTEAAKKVFDEAVDAMEKRQWAVCKTKAEGAWGQFKAPRIAAVLGLCEAELGLNRDAAEHLDFFLRDPKDASPKQVAQVKQRLEQLRTKVARVSVKPTPADAEVSINGDAVGAGAQVRYVEPGEVTITVAKNGQARSRTVMLAAGAEETTELEVPTVDGSDAGANGAGGEGGAGAAGGTGGTGGTGGEGAGPEIRKPLWPTLVFAGVGAVGIGSGIGLATASASHHGDAQDQAECAPFTALCEETGRDALSTADALMSGAIVGFSLGGAALVGMAVWLVVPMPSRADVSVLPVVGPSVNGLSLSGSF